MGSKIEPAIWSRDTGHRIPCFDRCQLTHSSIDPNMGVQYTIFINGGRTVEVWTEYMITRPNNEHVSFYNFPEEEGLRKVWIHAIRRDVGRFFHITKTTKCVPCILKKITDGYQ